MEHFRDKNSDGYNYDRDVNSVLLLRDMHNCEDTDFKRQLYEQVCNQEFSHICEVLPGEVRTEFKFDTYNDELFILQPYGQTDWLRLHMNGLANAQTMAREDPGFNFYAEIAAAELIEAEKQQHMVKVGKPATMVALSLCGNDVADNAHLQKLGRDPVKQRGYLRVSYFDGDKLTLYSRSIDGLNIEHAKQIYSDEYNIRLGAEKSSIDILKMPIHFAGDKRDLLDKIAKPIKEDTYNFVLEQKDLLKEYMGQLDKLADKSVFVPGLDEVTNNLRYDVMASFKRRLEGNWDSNEKDIGASMAYAGYAERSLGTQFAGCDNIISANKSLEDTGYFNTFNEKFRNLIRTEFKSKFCPQCLPRPKAGKSVKAWKQGDKLGCTNCGHVVDVCTKKIIKKGRKPKKKSSS